VLTTQVDRLEQDIDALNAHLAPLNCSFCLAEQLPQPIFIWRGRFAAGLSAWWWNLPPSRTNR
jgi:glucose/arabinose dehydrogenase